MGRNINTILRQAYNAEMYGSDYAPFLKNETNRVENQIKEDLRNLRGQRVESVLFEFNPKIKFKFHLLNLTGRTISDLPYKGNIKIDGTENRLPEAVGNYVEESLDYSEQNSPIPQEVANAFIKQQSRNRVDLTGLSFP